MGNSNHRAGFGQAYDYGGTWTLRVMMHGLSILKTGCLYFNDSYYGC